MSIDETASGDPRWWRYLYRVPLLLAHLLVGLPLTLLTINPLGRRIAVAGETLPDRMIRWWSATLCRIFGVGLNRIGELLDGPVMILANHIGWIDIEVLHSQRAVSFVAKAEIARWPLIGRMARAGGTVFHARGSEASRYAVTDALADKLRGRHSVAIFPEGRTSSGALVLPFHGRLLKAAIDAQAPIQPLALAYRRGTRLVNSEVAFRDGEHFMGNFFRLLREAPLTVDIVCAEPIRPDGRGRRDLARAAHDEVVAALEARDER